MNLYRSVEVPKNRIMVNSLTITSPPTTTIYSVGDTLDTTGLVVTATGSDGFSGTVTNYCVVSPLTLDTAGTQPITVAYGGKSVSFNVTVENNFTIAITTPPTKLVYDSGDALDLTGIVVTAYYHDSTQADVTSQCTFNPANGTIVTSSGTITATFEGETATCNYTVAGAIGTLEQTSWDTIKSVGAEGTGSQYWAIGDTKTITLNGNIGDCLTLANFVCKVFIIEFNYRNVNGVYFQGFKTTDGTDIALCDSNYGSYTHRDLTVKDFSLRHSWESTSYSYGQGWQTSEMRYDILGATETPPDNYMSTATNTRVGYDATNAAITTPISNTIMSALPSALRNALSLWTVWCCSTSAGYEITDAITLLNYPEVTGQSIWRDEYENGTRSYQMSYYASGNSKIKYKHSDTSTACTYYLRTVGSTSSGYGITDNGEGTAIAMKDVFGIAPAFRVA